MSDHGIRVSRHRVDPDKGGLSYLCAQGDHAGCSGAVALTASRVPHMVAIHPCNCPDCRCSEGVDLEAVATQVRRRAARLARL